MKQFVLLIAIVFSFFLPMACESQREEGKEAREELREEAQEFREEQRGEKAEKAGEELREEAQEFTKEQKERESLSNQVLPDEMKRPTGSEREKRLEESTGTSGQAQINNGTKGEFRGEVIEVQGDNVIIKDETGKTHSLSISESQNPEDFKADILEVGDKVRVEFGEWEKKRGKEYSIYRLEE